MGSQQEGHRKSIRCEILLKNVFLFVELVLLTERYIDETIGIILIINGMCGFTSNTLLITFPIILSVYIVYRMHKVEKRMVKTKAMNTQGDKN